MRIDKLHIQDFGQFHEKDVTLAPGINVIYGANEAGKSTMKDFIVDMFYGIDTSQGMGNRFDHYDQRKPISGSAYSGAMEISIEGHDYLIERNFSRQEKKTVLRDLDTGKEVPLQDPDNLVGTVLHTDKSTYLNTLCIGQMGAATDKEITERLNNYIINMASTKAGDIDAVSAIKELTAKKEEFSNVELEAREQELTSKLQLDRDFDAELAQVREEAAKAEASKAETEQKEIRFSPIRRNRVEEQDAESVEETGEDGNLTKREKEIKMLQNMGKKSFLDNVMVILLLGLLVVAVFIGIAAVMPVSSQAKMVIIGSGIFYSLISVIQILVKRNHLYSLLEEIEIEQGFEEAKTETSDSNMQKELAHRMTDIKQKEERIATEKQNQEQYLTEIAKLREQIAANNIETEAIDFAIKTIRDLSEEIYDSFGEVLNEQVSAIVSKITNNRYTEVKIDDQLRVMVRSGSSFISMEFLSTGTMEQIYLALRLAIANVLIKEELPIVMDDIFVTYDYQRIYETLSCLGGYLNRQIILFTTNPGIQDMFTGLGIESNYIAI